MIVNFMLKYKIFNDSRLIGLIMKSPKVFLLKMTQKAG